VVEQQDRLPRHPGLGERVGDDRVRRVGGRHLHTEPYAAELSPAARAGEVAEQNGVVDGVGGVFREREQAVEEVPGAAPVALPRDESGLLAREHGGQSLVGGLEGGGGGGEAGGAGVAEGRRKGKAC
jgi:hypothetical protein